MTKDESIQLAVLQSKLDALTAAVSEKNDKIDSLVVKMNEFDRRLDGQRVFAIAVISTASTIAGFIGWMLGYIKDWLFK